MILHSLMLKFTNRLEQNDADHYCQSDIISDLKSFRLCPTRSMALQCDLSAGKLKFVILV